jgi:NhaP-type Na+/H+ or K+/H+ antiporter
MIAVLVFAITLVLAVLLSGLANRSVLSAAVLFLVVGFVCGGGGLGLLAFQHDDAVVAKFAELALFSVLFTDGMHVGLRDLATTWYLPGRALLLGMPLTLGGGAILAYLVVGLPWAESLLIGAVLSPTDPVFAAAIIGREEVPQRLRRLLNVESGLNDGLALPVVIAMLGMMGTEDSTLATVFGEVVLGVALGIVIPWITIRLEHSRFFSAAHIYEPLHAFAVGILILALTSLTHANEFLAAFAAGSTMATVGPELREAFEAFGALVTELLKLAALLVFGALISLQVLTGEVAAPAYLFTLLMLVVVRPLAFGLALLGSQLPWREQVAIAWFGPKGFASVVLGLMIWKSGLPQAHYLFHLVALVIAVSIIVHSSTDVVVARWFKRVEPSAEANKAMHGSMPQRRDGVSECSESGEP